MSESERVLTRLRAAIERARSRVSTLENLLRSFETTKAKLTEDEFEALIGTLSPQFERIAPDQFDVAEGDAPPQRQRGELSPRGVADLARDTLLAAGKPLKRGQLVRELEKRGVPLAGADKNKNLGTILWRHRGLFVSLPKLGYWARGVPLKGAYDPETYNEAEAILEESPTYVERPDKDASDND